MVRKKGGFLVILLLLLVGVLSAASADEAKGYQQFSRGLGFSGGNISGVGLSYRQWFGKFGFQGVAGGYYVPVVDNTPGVSSLDYWAGLEGFYRLYENQFADWFYSQLYLFLGANHYGSITPVYPSGSSSAPPTPGTYKPEFILGGGIGIEAGLFQHISLIFEIGYGVVLPTYAVELSPQGAVQYRF